MKIESHTPKRSRVPNGVAEQRLRVALPEPMLKRIQDDAAKNLRTVSAMAAQIITRYYESQPVTEEKAA